MIGTTERYATVKGCQDKTQSAALTASLHGNILAIPLRKGGEEIDSTHQSEIDVLHVIMLARVETLTEIAIGASIEGCANLLKLLLRHSRIESMYLCLKAYATIVCVITMAKRFLNSLYASSRRAYYDRASAFLVGFRNEEITIDALSLLVYFQANEISISLVSVIFMRWFDGIIERKRLQCFHFFLPESGEISRFLGVRHDFIHGEAHFHMM